MDDPKQGSGGFFVGGLLIAIGVVFLCGQFLHVNLERFGWPFFILIPGVLVCALALMGGGRSGQGFFSFGSMVTMTGLLLLYQNLTDHWASWAYAWALITPTSVGLGHVVYGSLRDDPQMVKRGLRVVKVGLSIFLVGAIFFELLLNISGHSHPWVARYLVPVLLIAFGLYLLRPRLIDRSSSNAPTVAVPGEPVEKAQTAAEVEDPKE